MKNHTDSLWHVLNMQILHLDQTLLWSSREIREHSLWNLWEASIVPGSLLLRAAGCALVGRGLITVKGRGWRSLPESHMVCAGKGGRVVGEVEWMGGRWWREESGACYPRNRILTWPVWSQKRNIRRWLALMLPVVWGWWMGGEGSSWVGGWEGVRVVTHTSGHTLNSNKWKCIESSLRATSPQSILLYSSISLHRIFSMAEHI